MSEPLKSLMWLKLKCWKV